MSLRRALITGVALTALCSLAFGAGPAGAVACPAIPDEAADGAIADSEEPFFGNGIHNRTGEGQSVFYGMGPGEVVNSGVRYLNNDDVTHTIVVQARLTGDVNAFKVTFFQANVNRDITSKILRPQGRAFRDIAGGGNAENIRVRVKKLAGADAEAQMLVKITGNYETASKCGDTLKVHALEPV